METALRVRYQVNGDPVLGSLAHQAARCAALSEALADSLFEGTLEAQRRTQERYVAVTRNYRKAVDLLASSSGRTPKPKSGADLVRLHRVAKAP